MWNVNKPTNLQCVEIGEVCEGQLRQWHQLIVTQITMATNTHTSSTTSSSLSFLLLCPRPVGGGGGIKRWSASVVRPSVCLMSRTSALTRKPKGLGRQNFTQEYPRSHATPTSTSRSKGQKSRSRGGVILWRPPSRTAVCKCSRCVIVVVGGMAKLLRYTSVVIRSRVGTTSTSDTPCDALARILSLAVLAGVWLRTS